MLWRLNFILWTGATERFLRGKQHDQIFLLEKSPCLPCREEIMMSKQGARWEALDVVHAMGNLRGYSSKKK